MACIGAAAVASCGVSPPFTTVVANDDIVPEHYQCQQPQQQQQQRHLLRCCALADLLGVSSTVMQQLVDAAARPSNSMNDTLNISFASSHHSTASESVMQAYQPLQILVAAVLKQLSDRCFDSSKSSPHVSAVNAVQSAALAVSTVERKPAQTCQPSSLKAPPWSAALSEPPSVGTSPKQSDGESLLPSVLCSPQGVARVDALHPSFLPLLLVALLQRVSTESSNDTHDTGATVPMQKDGANAAKSNTSAAVSPLRQQLSCRDALQRLLPLYMPLLLHRRRAACAVVSSIVEALQGYSCSHRDDGENTTEVENRKRINRLVHRELLSSETKQWLFGARLLSDTLVACLDHVSRRGSAAAGAAPPSPSRAVMVDEEDLMEGRWTLEMAGVWLSVAGMPHEGGKPVMSTLHPSDLWWWEGAWREVGRSVSTGAEQQDPDAGSLGSTGAPTNQKDGALLTATTSEVLVLAEVMYIVGEETREGIWHNEGGHPSEQQQQHAPSSGGAAGGCIVSMLRDVMASFPARHHESRVLDPPAPLSASKVTATEHRHRYAFLLAERLETEQRHQHRLLAAAERAVHRILRQQHRQDLSVLWQSPEMMVALCSVTAYQLRTQLYRREQRMADLSTEATVTWTAAMFSSPHTCCMDSLPSGSMAAAAAIPAQRGEWLWSEEDSFADDAAAPQEKSQEQSRAQIIDAGAELSASLRVMSSTAHPTTKACAAAETAIAMSSPPPPRPPASSAPSSVHLPVPLRYTPRASSLHHGSCVYETPPAMHASADAPPEAGEEAGDREPLTRGNDDYYAPARSMENLWELPARVPRDWTPALATLMACCVLCLSSSSTTAASSRLAVLLGEALLNCHSTEAEFAHCPASTILSGSASEPFAGRVANLRPDTPDFGRSKRHEAPAATAAGASVRSSICSRSASNSIAGVSMALDSTNSGGESAGCVVAVGALAQWHLRGLIRQLRLPVSGRGLLNERAVRDRLGGSHAKVSPACSASASSSRALLRGAVNRTSETPSSTGATAGRAAWFTLYNGAARASVAAAPSSPPAGGVLRRLDPVTLVASCFASMHLLQTQPRFFQKARLGGRAMQELRLAVRETRWGIEPVCATQMLQRHISATSTVTVTVNSVPRTLAGGTASEHAEPRTVGAGAPWSRQDALRLARGRSLWDSSNAGAPEAATEGLRGIVVKNDSGDGDDDNADAPVPTAAAEAYGNMDDCCGDEAAAATCNLTEAFMVAVSYLGCRALAAALAQFAAPVLGSVEAVDASHISCGIGSTSAAVASSSSRELWCDALQAITGLLLEAHRVHRSGSADYRDRTRTRSRGILSSASRSVDGTGTLGSTTTTTTTAKAGAPLPASRASSSASAPPKPSGLQQPFCSGPVPMATYFQVTPLGNDAGSSAHAAASTPMPIAITRLMPAPLSTEAQFGIGAFFITLARALLQLNASSSPTVAEATSIPGSSSQRQQRLQRILCIVQCLYAVASVIDDVLHDYSSPPPAVLCNVLAMMLAMQPLHHPSATVKKTGATAPSPHGSDTRTTWEALRLTPFWDDSLLSSLEAASRAWVSHEERGTAASSDSAQKHQSTARQLSRLSRSKAKLCETSSASHIHSVFQSSHPPWQSLLGHLPCSRDPFSTSWLPMSFRGSSHSGASSTLLASIAKEDDLLLADSLTATAASTAGAVRQLSFSVVASARYAEWMETLCNAWKA
ncbi:hypothetical protein, unknown function [Leishmania tarentolae]|uniref:Uncharacterized protein n=1 Tax=Leishmania tarentolae TaxID=5689 RepID=A0A640KCU6_LEITA|nr:hypothetical protein, unknown function [Leishmania tarentolae]